VKLFVLAMLGVLSAAACGGETTSATPTPLIVFAMVAQNGSGASGTGTVVRGADSFTITVKLTRLEPSSSHISHLHDGACGAPGGIAFALKQVIADSAGAATITSTIPAGYLVPASGWYVNVHHGPDFTEDEYAPSDSCGDLPHA
jgi:CHRD domain